MNIEITDQAEELALAIEQLSSQKPSGDATWTVFRRAIGEVSDEEYWELLAVLRSRIRRMEEFVSSVHDKQFTDAKRNQVRQALANFARAFEPSTQCGPWQNATNYVRSSDALALSWFSDFARRYKPLRRVSDEDRTTLLERLKEVLSEIEEQQDVPGWAKEPLKEGLLRLGLVLRHLHFFGTEMAMDGLFNLREQAISISEQLKAQAESPQQSERSTATIGKVLAFILGAAALFHLPPEFAGDLKWYRAWIIDSPRLPPSETRLLPAPYAVEPKPPTPENPTEGTAGATSGGTEDGIAP